MYLHKINDTLGMSKHSGGGSRLIFMAPSLLVCRYKMWQGFSFPDFSVPSQIPHRDLIWWWSNTLFSAFQPHLYCTEQCFTNSNNVLAWTQ